MKVVDSVGWIEYFAAGSAAQAYRPYIHAQSEIVTPTIVLYEVYKRLTMLLGEDAAALATAQMLKTVVAPLDDVIALSAAELGIRHRLAMADAIVYATARHYGAVVVTSDAHFRDLPGIEFIPKSNVNK